MYLDHQTDVTLGSSKLGRVLDFEQDYEVQVMPHVMF